jgi:hypothetical protein
VERAEPHIGLGFSAEGNENLKDPNKKEHSTTSLVGSSRIEKDCSQLSGYRKQVKRE